MSPTYTTRDIQMRMEEHDPVIIPSAETERRAAVALIFREIKGPLELLFIKRTEDPRDPWSGHMAFPGGHLDPEDQDGRQGAVRECREEVGLDLDEVALYLGRLSDVMAVARGKVMGFAIEPHCFELREEARLTIDGSEVDHALWIPMSHLADPEQRETMTYHFEGRDIELPCIPYRGHIIWGLSLYMLFLFLALMEGKAPPPRFGR